MLAIFDFLFSQRSGSSAGILADEIISRRFESQKRSFGHLRIRSELYATLRLLCHFTWCALWFMFWEFSGKEKKIKPPTVLSNFFFWKKVEKISEIWHFFLYFTLTVVTLCKVWKIINASIYHVCTISPLWEHCATPTKIIYFDIFSAPP